MLTISHNQQCHKGNGAEVSKQVAIDKKAQINSSLASLLISVQKTQL
jgi:hypothetical protein